MFYSAWIKKKKRKKKKKKKKKEKRKEREISQLLPHLLDWFKDIIRFSDNFLQTSVSLV